jgi:excisionase family DNA binding protein
MTSIDRSKDRLDERSWLSIGTVRDLLQISDTTLRQWADTGLVRTYRTPGGHRRFSREDIRTLVRTRDDSDGNRTAASENELLQGIRRRLSKVNDSDSSWHTSFSSSGQNRMRELGRSLISACSGVPSRQKTAQLAASVRAIGLEQGAEAAFQGVPLVESLQAFTFFRTALLEAFKESLPRQQASAARLARVWRQVIRLTDESLFGLVRGYERTVVPGRRTKNAHA